MPQKLVILDVDGVLNPLASPEAMPAGFRAYELAPQNEVFLHLELQRKALRALAAEATLVWGSARLSQANLLAPLLELPPLPHIPLITTDVGMGTWKLKSIREYLAAAGDDYGRVLWLEDELEADAYAWAQERGDTLALAPVREKGLTAEDFARALSFIAAP